ANYVSRNITSYQAYNEVTLDGRLNASEWADAEYYTTNNLVTNMTIHSKHDNEWVYFGITIFNDNTLYPDDYCEIYFDLDNDSFSTIIDLDDRKFMVNHTNATQAYDGEGDTWNTNNSMTWDAKSWTTNGNVSFEIKVNKTMIWGLNPLANDTVPFGVHFYSQAGGFHIWYGDRYDTVDQDYDETPTDWGLLGYSEAYEPVFISGIPEFSSIYIPILSMLVMMVIVSKRRRRKK
ncbi:unnamed protein product, partial [marine sediment metagenome]